MGLQRLTSNWFVRNAEQIASVVILICPIGIMAIIITWAPNPWIDGLGILMTAVTFSRVRIIKAVEMLADRQSRDFIVIGTLDDDDLKRISHQQES